MAYACAVAKLPGTAAGNGNLTLSGLAPRIDVLFFNDRMRNDLDEMDNSTCDCCCDSVLLATFVDLTHANVFYIMLAYARLRGDETFSLRKGPRQRFGSSHEHSLHVTGAAKWLIYLLRTEHETAQDLRISNSSRHARHSSIRELKRSKP